MYGVNSELNSASRESFYLFSSSPSLPPPLRQTEALDLNDINLILEDIYVQSRPHLPLNVSEITLQGSMLYFSKIRYEYSPGKYVRQGSICRGSTPYYICSIYGGGEYSQGSICQESMCKGARYIEFLYKPHLCLATEVPG